MDLDRIARQFDLKSAELGSLAGEHAVYDGDWTCW